MLVGFEWWQQALIDSWLPALERVAGRRPGLRVYELVVVPGDRLPARGIIDGGMVAGIPSREVRARTLTAYADLPRVLSGFGLSDTRDIALFLLDGSGHVLWSVTGGHDPEKAKGLDLALQNGATVSGATPRDHD